MNTVKELLDKKGREVYRVAHDASLSLCARTMMDHEAGSLLIFKEEALVGIFTWHDLVRAVARHDDVGHRPVSDFMSRDLLTTTEAAEWSDVEEMMVKNHVRHLPVVDDGRVVGVVQRHDVVANLCHAASAVTAELDAYIRSEYPR